MKVVILNGIDKEYTKLNFGYDIVCEVLNEIGWKSETYMLYQKEIEYCKGCFGCWIKTPGECVIKDNMQSILKTIGNSDILVLITNLICGSYSSNLKKAMDRFLPLLTPTLKRKKGKTMHMPRYTKYPCIAGIGVMISPEQEAEKIFTNLIKHNSMHLFAPKSATTILFLGQSKEKSTTKIKDLFKKIYNI